MSPGAALRTGVKNRNKMAGPIFNLDNGLYPSPDPLANEFRENSQDQHSPRPASDHAQ